MAISSPLQSKVPVGSSKTIRKLQTILLNRTKVKREIFQKQTILQNRRIENERRKQREDELEAPNLVTKPRGAAGLIAGSAKGFFERLVGFLSYLTAGWIINNLPTWISMGKEFIARTQQMGKILGGFITNSTNIFKNFTKLLGAGLTNLMKFDFLDTSGRVSTAFDELNLSVENWGAGFEDVIKLITTPLTEGIASGEDARPLGTENTNEGAYERTAPYSGSGGYSKGKIPESVKSDTKFTEGVASLAKKYNIPEDYLYALMAFETGGSFSPSQKNRAGSGATGLIQFMPETAKGLGTSTSDLSKMSRSEQLKYVDKYFSGKGIEGGSLSDTYMAVLFPAAVGKPEDFVLFGKGAMKGYTGIAYEQNKGLDLNKDGSVTKAEASTKVKEYLPRQSQAPQQSSAPPKDSKGGKIVEYLTGDRTHKRYRADHAAGNYHDHVAFDSQKTRDAAMAFLRGKGWTIGSINTGRHADGSYHYSNQAFDIPFYPNQSKKGVTDDVKGETKLSSRLRSDLISGGFGGPQLGGSSTSSPSPAQTSSAPARQQSPTPSPAQITPTGTPQNPQISQSLAPERTGPTVIVSQNPSSPARQMMSSGGGSSGGGSSQISEFTLLNNFIKNKLLLDLAYL
jgi:hypothetical protein